MESNPEGDGDANDTRPDEATMTRLLDTLRRLVGSTGHAIIRANMPGYTWTWCWIDEIKV